MTEESAHMAGADGRSGKLAAGLLSWWTGELAALLPDRLAHRLPGSEARLVLDLSGPRWVLLRRRGGRHGGLVPVAEQAGDASTDRARLRALGLRNRPVSLRAPARTLLAWRLSLPASAAADLRAAIAFQIERKTPFSPADTHFGYRVLRRDTGARQIELEVALVPKSAADELAARAADLGLVATALIGDAGDDGGSRRIALPAAARPRSPWRWTVRALAVTAVVLAGLIVQTALAERTRTEQRLADELRTARAAAERVQQQRAADDLWQSIRAALIDRRRATPSTVRTLDTVTRLLSDDVWLTQFTLSGGDAQAAGHAPAASALIGLIDAAEPFSAPRFLAAITLDTTIGLERFNLAFTVGTAP